MADQLVVFAVGGGVGLLTGLVTASVVRDSRYLGNRNFDDGRQPLFLLATVATGYPVVLSALSWRVTSFPTYSQSLRAWTFRIGWLVWAVGGGLLGVVALALTYGETRTVDETNTEKYALAPWVVVGVVGTLLALAAPVLADAATEVSGQQPAWTGMVRTGFMPFLQGMFAATLVLLGLAFVRPDLLSVPAFDDLRGIELPSAIRGRETNGDGPSDDRSKAPQSDINTEARTGSRDRSRSSNPTEDERSDLGELEERLDRCRYWMKTAARTLVDDPADAREKLESVRNDLDTLADDAESYGFSGGLQPRIRNLERSVNARIEVADALGDAREAVDIARTARGDRDFEEALGAFDGALIAYESAVDTADGTEIDTDAIDDERSTIENERSATQVEADIHERLAEYHDRVNGMGDRLVDSPKDVRKRIRNVASDLDDLAATARDHDLPELATALESLDHTCTGYAETADSLATAREYAAGARQARMDDDYETALDAFDEALTHYQAAIEAVADTDVDADAIDDERTTVAEERDETRTERDLHSRLDDLRERVEATIDRSGDPETVRDRFETLAAELDDLVADARERGLDDLAADARELAATCEDRITSLAQQAATSRKGPPDSVPRAPSLSLTYGDLDRGAAIGQGGNADVYRATATVDGESHELALKLPHRQGTDSVKVQVFERFREEAETWSKLDDHDHVVGVVDWGIEPLPWIAMEYMDAGDLGGRIDECEIDEALWIALSVTEAVLHAHRRGVVHLDLKPANILFRDCGSDAWAVPKVADWGLAKVLLDRSRGVEMLTPQYAAPEQLNDDAEPDHATDIYQLGAVFYELFTGSPIHVEKISEGSVTRPTDVAPTLPAELDDVLLTALAKEPADRYGDVVYFRDDLQGLYETHI